MNLKLELAEVPDWTWDSLRTLAKQQPREVREFYVAQLNSLEDCSWGTDFEDQPLPDRTQWLVRELDDFQLSAGDPQEEDFAVWILRTLKPPQIMEFYAEMLKDDPDLIWAENLCLVLLAFGQQGITALQQLYNQGPTNSRRAAFVVLAENGYLQHEEILRAAQSGDEFLVPVAHELLDKAV